jgi:hypothetical protein
MATPLSFLEEEAAHNLVLLPVRGGQGVRGGRVHCRKKMKVLTPL